MNYNNKSIKVLGEMVPMFRGYSEINEDTSRYKFLFDRLNKLYELLGCKKIKEDNPF